MGLGLIAVMYYLTATYKRSPSFLELAKPLVPGVPLLALGTAGLAASYGYLGSEWTGGQPFFYAALALWAGGFLLRRGGRRHAGRARQPDLLPAARRPR